MSKRDYYELLGVGRDADDEVIKSAYRKQAMQYHPDRNPGDHSAEEKFKEVTEAYEILKDSQKRHAYDQYGHAGVNQGRGFGAGQGFEGFDLGDALRAFMRDFGSGGGGGGGSIFDEFFGGSGGHRRQVNRGEDLRVRIKLTLEEVATGVEKKVRVKRQKTCESCTGSGVAAGASKQTCPQCRGAGQVRKISQTFLGTVQQVATCNMCRGAGQVIADPCRICRGEGRVADTATVNINIPAGVSSGNYMTIENMGNTARQNGETGDLIAVFEEKSHNLFTRHGDNILYEGTVSFISAALGGEIEVPTLSGIEKIKIPAGMQSGKVIKLKGKGIPKLHRSGQGDQLVQLTVWVPTHLSGEEKNILKTLRSSESFRPPKSDKSFFERLRETLGV